MSDAVPMTIGQIPARLVAIEAKLDTIIAAMDHASGEPDAVCERCQYWRAGKCVVPGLSELRQLKGKPRPHGSACGYFCACDKYEPTP